MQCSTHEERETEVTCKECGKALCEECTVRLRENPYCQSCVEKAKGNLAEAVKALTMDINWGRAMLFGIIVAAIGALVWNKVEMWFNLRIGIVAIAIGYGVAQAVMIGAGGKRGRGLQVMSLLLSAVGIVGGILLSTHDQVLQEIAKGTIKAELSQSWLVSVVVLPFVLKETSIMSLVIMAFGLYQGFALPAMPKVKM